MQSSHDTPKQNPTLNMLIALDKLKDLREQMHSLSNARRFLSNIKSFTLAYNQLDNETKSSVNSFMKNDHKELLEALQKSGSQLPKATALAGMINDNLIDGLKRILNHPILHVEANFQNNEKDLDTGTFKIVTADKPSPLANDDQLKVALDSPNIKKTSPSYLTATFFRDRPPSLSDNPLAVIVSAFEILIKTNKNKTKEQGKLSEQFKEAYENTLLREMGKLNFKVCQSALDEVTLDTHQHFQLLQIRILLDDAAEGSKDPVILLSLAEKIIASIDEELLNALRQAQTSNLCSPKQPL